MSKNSYQGVNVGAIVTCTARENTRYSVRGAEVRRHPQEGVFISATNGRVLAVIHDMDAEAAPNAKPSIIPGEILPTTKTGKRNIRCLLNGDWHAIDVISNKPTIKAPEHDGVFPPCASILPELSTTDGRKSISLNIGLLKALADAIGDDTGGGPILTLWIGAPDKPVVCVGRQGTMGVAMPVNRDDVKFVGDHNKQRAEAYEETRKWYEQTYKD